MTGLWECTDIISIIEIIRDAYEEFIWEWQQWHCRWKLVAERLLQFTAHYSCSYGPFGGYVSCTALQGWQALNTAQSLYQPLFWREPMHRNDWRPVQGAYGGYNGRNRYCGYNTHVFAAPWRKSQGVLRILCSGTQDWLGACGMRTRRE